MSWDPRPGTKGPAGGDLAGTYPDPSVAKVPSAALTAGTGVVLTTATGKAEASVPTAPITAETAVTGVALINGLQTILSVTVPNDGQVHMFYLSMQVHVTAALTGGTREITWTTPATLTTPTHKSTTVSTVGYHAYTIPYNSATVLCAPGSIVSIAQSVAMTAGAAKVYAKIIVV